MSRTIRAAAAAEWRAITRVVAEAFAAYSAFAGPGWTPPEDMVSARVGERLAPDDAWGAVAEEDGALVAFSAFEPARDGRDGPVVEGLAHVWAVFALPSRWGTGAAGEVLAAVVAEIGRRGYREARLFTPELQARARAFYRREGWTERGDPLPAPPLGLDVVELRRRL